MNHLYISYELLHYIILIQHAYILLIIKTIYVNFPLTVKGTDLVNIYKIPPVHCIQLIVLLSYNTL